MTARSRSLVAASRERGVVLFVALMATIALTLAGIALVRAVATDVAIGGNLAMRQHATLAASDAIEQRSGGAVRNGRDRRPSNDDPEQNYFAARQAGDDGRGVPRALQVIANYPADAATIDAGDRLPLRHLIERLCLLPGSASADNCTLTPPSVAAASGTPGAWSRHEPPITASPFASTGRRAQPRSCRRSLGENQSHRRLSWRVLDE